jgi:hypothetical protein
VEKHWFEYAIALIWKPQQKPALENFVILSCDLLSLYFSDYNISEFL